MGAASVTNRKVWSDFERNILRGSGIDIGCGSDPVTPETRRFDREHGDANQITRHVHEQFDYVFSSHCLEHMHEPRVAIKEWWKLVKPGGHLFFIVPDEDLYEQGMWPSLFNPDHKATFTISKSSSWSRLSVNILDLVHSLENSELVDIRLQDAGYDRRYLRHQPCPWWWAKVFAALRGRLIPFFHQYRIRLGLKWFVYFGVPVDQMHNAACAQIQTIVRKRVHA